jgi:hypothetical protein
VELINQLSKLLIKKDHKVPRTNVS